MDELLYRQRHSAAHIMAEAVLEHVPGGQVRHRPADRQRLLLRLRPAAAADARGPRRRSTSACARASRPTSPSCAASASKDEARAFFADQPYKLELIDGIPDAEVGICKHGNFTDLCGYPHVESTGKVGAFKLTSVAGAYWRGDEHRPMLQRIYGVMFPTEEELDEHLHRLEEAERRDHRRLGRELEPVLRRPDRAGQPVLPAQGRDCSTTRRSTSCAASTRATATRR